MTAGKKGQDTEKKESLQAVHITRNLFCDWQADKLKGSEEEKFLGHIGACTFCAEQFATWMEETICGKEETGEYRKEQPALLAEPPSYLKEEILKKTRQMNVQAAIRIRETSRQMQLLLYSLKVGLAVTASIFLLVITTSIQQTAPEAISTQWEEQQQESGGGESTRKEGDITDTLRQKSGELSSLLNELSNGIFRIETEQE